MTRSPFARLLTAACLAGGFVFAASAQTNPPAPATPPGPAATVPPAPQPVTLSSIVPDGRPHRFEAKNKQFSIDGQPTLLIAGEIHFGRVLPEDFETRIKQAKAMGLNTVSFYMFWNLTEPQEGKFDFTGMNDVRRMLKLCQDNGMWAVLRPGPYCCAEVDYGGIPWWTLKYPDVKIRTNDPKYVEWSKRYIQAVYKEVADLQVTKGGPLVMVQLENEFGMVAAGDYSHMLTLRQIFKDVGFEVPLFVCDPGTFSPTGAAANPYGEDVLRGRNGLKDELAYRQAVNAAGDFPVYAPEVYTAWFSGWGQPIATRNSTIPAIVTWTNFLLNHNTSWCYYVFYGGTNWGYNTGCNEWLPLQTSYDYNAPIDEAGRTTPKFNALRDVLAARTNRTLPAPPPDPAVYTLPPISLTQKMPLTATLPAKATRSSKFPASMEQLDQDYGFVLYRKQFPAGIKGKLELKQVMDYAVTMVNGKTVGKTFVGYGPDSSTITLDEAGPATLDIFVQNLGRISVITNAASQNRAHKGLIGGAFLDGQEITGWDDYSLPLKDGPTASAAPAATDAPHTGPTFYRGTFTANQPATPGGGGTYLDMQNWGFGVVWVNGHNLGRFWDRGGIRSLYLPTQFLKQGANDITILELHDAPKAAQVGSTTKIVETPPFPFAIRLDQSRLPAGSAFTVAPPRPLE
jgi:beta-galactosidase